MKCRECPDYAKCVKESNLAIKRKNCPKARTEKVKTNADRIRAMSDEELYAWAKKQIGCGFDFFPCGIVCDGKCESYSDEDCKAKIMNWLQQPAKENEQ